MLCTGQIVIISVFSSAYNTSIVDQ